MQVLSVHVIVLKAPAARRAIPTNLHIIESNSIYIRKDEDDMKGVICSCGLVATLRKSIEGLKRLHGSSEVHEYMGIGMDRLNIS